ncbi:Asp23/Gls24 family envelope stress response protein [Candidatus Weimeria sp. HCP3S3_B5]|uniref:Asp23/Gls24 family envelope stress response protein n=1 Tax=Candidatus Weimeria sp. HCP3S3_B5 TaxID=3438871 RepID=UPI002A99BFC1|nr:Asp23/Gls24 family envelope stress response protein [Lachnospiraceae bacterium]MDY6352799.1 Asp23/Gls24 family envelope stress response protein [Lachnospiraceae bacterium]
MAENTFTVEKGVTVTDEVMATIAGLAASDVEGLAYIGNGLTRSNITKAGANKLSKGIHIIREEDGSVTVRLAIVLRYGYEVPNVCREIQDKVKTNVETMTGISVREVDVRIASIEVADAGARV